jgi:hypothetical protein
MLICSQRVGEYKGVLSIVFCTGGKVAIAKTIELFGIN